MPWLLGKDVIVHFRTKPPLALDRAPDVLKNVGVQGRWSIQWETQLAPCPHLNMNNLGVLASLKSSVWREGLGTAKEMVGGVKQLINEYNGQALERV